MTLRDGLIDNELPDPELTDSVQIDTDDLRVRDLVGYGRRKPKVVWPNGAALAVSFVINYEEGSEAYARLGAPENDGGAELPWYLPKAYRDLAMEAIYEYGSRAGVWRLIDMFEEFGFPLTFFAVAKALEMNREVAGAIREGGHEACSHGYGWDRAWLFTREEEAEQIRLAVESIEATTGSRPVGWYWRYSSSPWTRELLAEEGGFTYDSESYNDDLPYFVKAAGRDHLVIPYTHTYNDVRFVIAEGSHGSPSDFADHLLRGIDELRREGHRGYPKMMSVGLHSRWTGQASRANALRDVLAGIRERGDVWVARRADVAMWWREHHSEWAR